MLRRYAEAVAAYEEAIRLDPHSARAWSNKGIALIDLRHYAEALAALEEAIRLGSNTLTPARAWISWNQKGNALYYLGRYHETLAAYEEAIRLKPDHLLAWENKGGLLRNVLGRVPEAIVAEQHDLIIRYVESVWNKGDTVAPDEYIATTFVHNDPSISGGSINGPDGVTHLVTMFRTAFPDLNITIKDMIAEDDKIATRWTMGGTHEGEFWTVYGTSQGESIGVPPTGKYLMVTGISVYRIADGKIAEVWQIWDCLGLYQQLGVIPAEGSTNE